MIQSVKMWLLLLLMAVVLGGVRDLWLQVYLSELRAHQLETLLVCLVHLLLIRWFVFRVRPTLIQSIGVGALWTGMLLVFEYVFFHNLMQVPLADLMESFDLRCGRLFGLVVLVSLISPVVLRSLNRSSITTA